MTQETVYFPFSGGLDLVSPAIAIPPGRARAALNYEAHNTGYRRIDGFERYDGRTSPTDAYDNEQDENLKQSAMDAARAAITAVPGSGDVLGVWYYKGSLYAFRNNADGTAAVMHKATASGWTAVPMSKQLDFTSGGTYEIFEGDEITGATSGATATVKRVVTTAGSWSSGTAEGYVIFDSQTGTFQAEDLNVGTNLNVATIAGDSAAVTLPAGGRYEFITYNFYGSSDLHRMYGVNGVGKAFEFDGTTFCPITTKMDVDTPTRVIAHKKHLFLAFPGGELQHSGLGEPLSWSPITGAASLSVGDDITDLIINVGALTIFSKGSVSVLYGSDSSDWQLETLNDEAGCLPWTADKIGQAIYMDNRGVRQLEATQAYGNFSFGTLTQAIQSFVHGKLSSGVQPTAAVRVRAHTIYRVFFEDNSGISIFLGKRNPECMLLDLGKKVTCAVSAETENSVERIWFGSDDGFVYEMDKGRSFDGEPIDYYIRLPFNHLGAPQVGKRWHKAALECNAGGEASLHVSADFDYGDPSEPSFPGVGLTVQGGGGFWDLNNWDQFYWDAPLEGIANCYLDGFGKNISLLIVGSTADEPSHLLQGITLFFSVRGLRR